jgi:predicted metalloprotease
MTRTRPASELGGTGPAAAILAATVLAATVLSACGVDTDVVSLEANRTPASDVPNATEAPDPPARTLPPTDTTPDTTSDTTPDTTSDTTSDTTTTAPPPTTAPVVEPQLLVDVDLAAVIDVDDRKPVRDHDEFVAVALTDIERWWSDMFPAVYGDAFEPLAGGVFAGYPERETAVPGCGEPGTDYADLQLYVAFYCQLGDFMAYDDGDTADSLLTPLAEEYGAAVLGVVLAHEYGHAIQARIGALDTDHATIYTEQQADCFAGAWTGQAYRGESPLLRLGDTDVRAGLLAMLSVRDPVGTDQFLPGGHGSAFDRVGAFQEGFRDGPARCAELLDAPLDLMPNQFQTGVDAFFEGNAPYDCDELDPDVVGQELVDACTPAPVFLAEDINHFWRTAIGGEFADATANAVGDIDGVSCDGAVRLSVEVTVCPVERVVHYDEPDVLALYREFGDFSLGYLYGIGWGELAQRALGSSLTGEARALANDCFTGAWVRDITPDRSGNTPRQGDRDGDGEPDTVTSSPGDLDEAIRMAILVGDAGANVDVVGSPFEKIDAFRTGVLGGLAACTELL